MKQNLRVSLGAVVLALATLAAVIFALLNFDQRNRYDQTYDGVTWIDTEQGVQARHVAPNSPASHTAIHSGDILVTFNGAPISRAAEVARWLERAGLWTLVHYKLSRNGQEFETPLVTAPAEKPLATENYLRAVGLLYLFIGLFIFIVHPMVVPFQREAGHFRLGNLLVGNRGAPAGPRFAPSFRVGFSRADRVADAHDGKACGGLSLARSSARCPLEHGSECTGIRALARILHPAG